jgi:ATP-dependent DNA helicase RecQ
LGLPYRDAVRHTRPHAPQSEKDNIAQQFTIVYDSVAVDGVLDGPVLLVDDTVDSRWTITVVGALLLDAGVAAVHPFVLAKAMSD